MVGGQIAYTPLPSFCRENLLIGSWLRYVLIMLEGRVLKGTFTTAEHGGTHVDAPYHFAKHGKTVEQLRLKDLIAPCFVIDVRSKCYP